jgi:plasmid stabilization system protein ParE
MTGYQFHPEARADLDEIWEYIRADSLDAADRMIADLLSAIDGLVPFPHQGQKRPTSPHGLYVSSSLATT